MEKTVVIKVDIFQALVGLGLANPILLEPDPPEEEPEEGPGPWEGFYGDYQER